MSKKGRLVEILKTIDLEEADPVIARKRATNELLRFIDDDEVTRMYKWMEKREYDLIGPT